MSESSTAKRIFDVTAALMVLVLAAPVIALVALAVRRRLGRGVLFRQTRPGLHGRPFEMMKFRTMLEPDPARGPGTAEQRLPGALSGTGPEGSLWVLQGQPESPPDPPLHGFPSSVHSQPPHKF